MKRCERSARLPVGCSALEPLRPDVKYVSVPAGMKQNRPPTESMQYFGLAKIDGTNRALTMALHDLTGKALYSIGLQPA